MRLYQAKTLLLENADFPAFTKLYAEAVQAHSPEPFLLVRDDDARLLVVTHEYHIMLCRADGPDEYWVSNASSYLEGSSCVMGLTDSITIKAGWLIEPAFAIKAIQAFFNHQSMSDFVDFYDGRPEPEIMTFPSKFKPREMVEYDEVQLHVTVTDELRADMKEVCEYLDDNEGDPDFYIDFDDAIQIGSLCGGRINRRRNKFLFTYYRDNGEKWHFEVPRTMLDGIADGSISKLTVDASIPKQRHE